MKFNPYSLQSQYKILSASSHTLKFNPYSSKSQKNNYRRENSKLKKNIDSLFDREYILAQETRCVKCRPLLPQCKEKPTLVLFKNKRSGEPRSLDESKYENSTRSAYNTSTTSTQFTENSSNRVACQCPLYKSQYAINFKDRFKHDKQNSRFGRSSLFSSPSSLSSSKRHHSWTAMSQDSFCHKQKPISSSSCTNIQRWKRRSPKNAKETSTYPSSTSSSTSLSTYKKGCEFERINDIDQTMYTVLKGSNDMLGEEISNIRELKKNRKLWKRPRFREHEKKRAIYMNERHVRWNIKHTY